MTREEAEAKIYEHMKAIAQICKEYCPEDGYFTGCVLNNVIRFNNAHWEHEGGNELDFWEEVK